MKKSICALLLMLSLVPLLSLAQTEKTTFKRDFSYRFNKGLTVDVQMSVPGYYDENDYEILNGQFKANGKETYSTHGINGTYTYSATGNGCIYDNELVILIDVNSASASEILSSALQENKRAVLFLVFSI